MKCKNALPADFDYSPFKYGDQVRIEPQIIPARDGSANVSVLKMIKVTK